MICLTTQDIIRNIISILIGISSIIIILLVIVPIIIKFENYLEGNKK